MGNYFKMKLEKLFIGMLAFLFIVGAVSATIEVQSPEAASFSQVDGAEPGADGGVGFSIPVGTVSGRNGFDFPINLNYGAGIKLNQEASWVGLGFSLGFGAVSRSPIGVPDDYLRGWLNGGQDDFGDQDYYSISFPGGGGKIIFDDNKVPHLASWQNMRIEVFDADGDELQGSSFNGAIDKWIVTTMDGTRYVFEEKAEYSVSVEESGTFTMILRNSNNWILNTEEDQNTDDPFTNTWYLSEIVSADYFDSSVGFNIGSTSWNGADDNDAGNWISISYDDLGDYFYKFPNPRTFHECELDGCEDNSFCNNSLVERTTQSKI